MITLSDVAKAAGVSPMTVSNALRGKPNVSDATRLRVEETAKDLGYRVNVVAKGLRSGKTGIIGLAVPDLNLPFSAHYAAAVTRAAGRRGIRVTVQETRSSKEAELALLQDSVGGLIDGIIISALGMSASEIQEAKQNLPIVLMDERTAETGLDVVCSPNYEGAFAAATHLAEVGCRRPLALGAPGKSPTSQGDLSGGDLRLLGFRDGLRSRGMILEDWQVIGCDWTAESSWEAVGATLRSGANFDGVFAMTDTVAFGAMRALADGGIACPDKVKVIGFDGIQEGEFSTPSLSTIRVDKEFLADSAIKMLLERISSENTPVPPRKVTAEFALLARESTRR